jgi:hypothetical protein
MIHHSWGTSDIAEDEDDSGFGAGLRMVGGAKVVCEEGEGGE